jgi:hypothetical protein
MWWGWRPYTHEHMFASRLAMAGVVPSIKLEAVQRLCDTGLALEGSTDTRTGTSGSEQFSTSATRPNQAKFS